jgi:S-adenosyl-L-methionine hydrolase (adenosine-forming)
MADLPRHTRTIVTLLTDFGLADTYVGQVRGAILAVTTDVQIIDLTHAVAPQDVRAGAFLLWGSVEVFPPGTIHLAVVDPGVGSVRRAIAARARRGDLFVGPDNGLLGPAIDRLGGLDTAVVLDRPAYWRPAPSSTFHGRDIFGPVAGHLAAGAWLDLLGSRIEILDQAFAAPAADQREGEVVHVDTYGNLVTSISSLSLHGTYRVHVDGWPTPVVPASHYAAVGDGEVLALVGSFGLLEIAARGGSAAAATGAGRGTRVWVEA